MEGEFIVNDENKHVIRVWMFNKLTICTHSYYIYRPLVMILGWAMLPLLVFKNVFKLVQQQNPILIAVVQPDANDFEIWMILVTI